MKYTPKHTDNLLRAIYGSLIVASFVLMGFGTGLVRTILMSLSVVFLAVGLFLFIRHEITTYSYIVMENGERLDFYVDKLTGKRGAYVCYYPMTDALTIEKYEKGIRKKLEQKYGKTFVYRYCHNIFCGEKYLVVFQNNGYCDAVLCQLEASHAEYIKKAISQSEVE